MPLFKEVSADSDGYGQLRGVRLEKAQIILIYGMLVFFLSGQHAFFKTFFKKIQPLPFKCWLNLLAQMIRSTLAQCKRNTTF